MQVPTYHFQIYETLLFCQPHILVLLRYKLAKAEVQAEQWYG